MPSECFQNKKLSTPNLSGYELVLVFEIFVRGHIFLIFKIFFGGQIFLILKFEIFKLKYFLKGSANFFNSSDIALCSASDRLLK